MFSRVYFTKICADKVKGLKDHKLFRFKIIIVLDF